MLFGKGKPRSLGAGRRGRYRPKPERLEGRVLLAIDLGGNTPPVLPAIANVPYGVEMASGNGGVANGGAGFSVTDLGDVNGDGFDDFFIGAPTVINNNGQITLNPGPNSRAYLVFGSRAVNAGNIDWLTLSAVQRVGDLSQLGNAITAQQNPITGQQGFAFSGLTFFTSQNNNSELGASVAPAGIINGVPAFLVGAPGSSDINGQNPFTGRAYLIYGGAGLNSTPTNQIDLDNPGGNQGVNFVTFTTSGIGAAQIGRSVAGMGDFFGENANSIAIGAPFATFNGNANAGDVFVISGAAIPTTNVTVNLLNVGQNGGTRGVVFGGPTGGANAGFAVANAGSVDAFLSGFNTQIPDLLIGAPGISTAFLVYGRPTLVNSGVTLGGIRAISLGSVGGPTIPAGGALGAVFTGTAGDGTGYSVSSAGDFDNNGTSDILIGAPFAGANTGLAYLIYGQPAQGSTLVGNITLSSIPATVLSATMVGETTGALAGYSVGFTGPINPNNTIKDDVLIGSPGLNNSAGAVYVLPGNPDLVGTFPLISAESSALTALKLTLTNPSVPSPSFFGASVSGRPVVAGQTKTADNDTVADFIVGAPGYGVSSGNTLKGAAFILEGRFLSTLVRVPTVTAITALIGVGAPAAANVTYTVNATTPPALQIFVDSNASIGFDPVKDINPASIFVNGVNFPNATIAKDPVDENGDGIEDAIITITPRANIGLTATTTTLTLRATGAAGTPIAGRTVLGTASIAVSGAPTPGPPTTVGVTSTVPIGTIVPTTFVPPFGNDRFVPAPSTLSMLNYQPIPWNVAYYQYRPTAGFEERILNYFFPSKYHFQRQRTPKDKNGTHNQGVWTLGQHVYDRGIYHAGKTIQFTHKVRVIPTNEQTERLSPTTPLGGTLP